MARAEAATTAAAAGRDEWPLRVAFLVSTTGDWIYRFALPLLVLELMPKAAIGRVASVSRAVSYLTMPVGALLGSVLVAHTQPWVVFAWPRQPRA